MASVAPVTSPAAAAAAAPPQQPSAVEDEPARRCTTEGLRAAAKMLIYRAHLLLITTAMACLDFDDPLVLSLAVLIVNALVLQRTLASDGDLMLAVLSQCAAAVAFAMMAYMMYRINRTEKYCEQYDELGKSLEEREPSALGPESTLPPEAGGAPPPRQASADLDANAARARELGPAFEERVMEPGLRRAKEKAAKDYSGDGARVVDLLRGTIVCSSIDEVVRCAAKLTELEADGGEDGVRVLRVKNRFRDGGIPGSGYRDLNTNLEFRGHVCELQFQIRAFYEIKHDAHSVYNVVRSLGVGGELGSIPDEVRISWAHRLAVTFLMLVSAAMSMWQGIVFIFHMPDHGPSVILATPWCLLFYLNVARMLRALRARNVYLAGAAQLALIAAGVYVPFFSTSIFGNEDNIAKYFRVGNQREKDFAARLTAMCCLVLGLLLRDLCSTIRRGGKSGVRRRSRIGLLYDRYLGLNGTHFVWRVMPQQLGMVALQAWTKLPDLGEMAICPFADVGVVQALFFVVLAALVINALYPLVLLPRENVHLQRDLPSFLDAAIDIVYGPVVFLVVLYATEIKFIGDPKDLLNYAANFTPTFHVFTVACGIELAALQRAHSKWKYRAKREEGARYHRGSLVVRLEGRERAPIKVLVAFAVAAIGVVASAVGIGCQDAFPWKAESTACVKFIFAGQTEVDLRGMAIDDARAVALAAALATNDVMLVFGLADNAIGDVGASALAGALETNTKLQRLSLRKNNVSDDGAEAFARMLEVNSALQSFDVCENPIGRRGYEAVGAALMHARCAVREVDLAGNGVSDPVKLRVAELRSGETQTLELAQSMLGDAGAFLLAALLSTNSSLRTLVLSSNSITDDGAVALAEALGPNTAVRTLDLRFNSFGDAGATALAGALKTNAGLQTLGGIDTLAFRRLWASDPSGLGAQGLAALGDALKSSAELRFLFGVELRTLRLLWTNDASLAGLELVLGGGVVGNTGALVLAAALRNNTVLRTLDVSLRDEAVQDEGAAALAGVLKEEGTALERLNGMDALPFRKLWRSDFPGLGSASLAVLADALRTGAALETLFGVELATLRALWGAAAPTPSSSNASTTTNATLLRALDLSQRYLEDEGAMAVAEALKTNDALRTLDLGANFVGDRGAAALGAALETNAALRTLDLRANLIGAEGVVALAEALRTNAALQSLRLGNFYDDGTQGGNVVGGEGAVALGAALRTNAALRTLDLSKTYIEAEGAVALAEGLKTNTTQLQTLILDLNSIGDDGATALAEALKTNAALQWLNLYNNAIGADGATALAEALKTNTALQTVHLHSNTIGDGGATALAEALGGACQQITENCHTPEYVYESSQEVCIQPYVYVVDRRTG